MWTHFSVLWLAKNRYKKRKQYFNKVRLFS